MVSTKLRHVVLFRMKQDLAKALPMHRLLQGEVGSGKTVVALYAALVAAQGGYQAAILAPTEVLAGQHFLTIASLLAPLSGTGDGQASGPGQLDLFGASGGPGVTAVLCARAESAQ